MAATDSCSGCETDTGLLIDVIRSAAARYATAHPALAVLRSRPWRASSRTTWTRSASAWTTSRPHPVNARVLRGHHEQLCLERDGHRHGDNARSLYAASSLDPTAPWPRACDRDAVSGRSATRMPVDFKVSKATRMRGGSRCSPRPHRQRGAPAHHGRYGPHPPSTTRVAWCQLMHAHGNHGFDDKPIFVRAGVETPLAGWLGALSCAPRVTPSRRQQP
jgi:hypothetical protein